ncbi:Response regulator receiver domain-containing protein [Tindallia magadiensis]|uniref:Stage 0 sporulation protein A homolog n=1 Tax=Tindallia magadiensis TaxID=69895 RepID=A0A1I3H9K9_9FIRM|nr:response regulator [Tindallia magadiensis]SFI32448.1 Response regulator receiver domain-containing protein [Tindallia magadiensis]
MKERETILFVDDEVNVLSSLKRGMLDEPYRCYFASSGKEALKILEENTISVIVTDMRMPEMNGLQLLEEVSRISPDTVKIVLSGYTQLQQILATINKVDIFKFITKPWKMEEEFKAIINQAVEYYRLKQEHQQMKVDLENRNKVYRNMLDTMTRQVQSGKRQSLLLAALGETMFQHIAQWKEEITSDSEKSLPLHQQATIHQILKKSILYQGDQMTSEELEHYFYQELGRFLPLSPESFVKQSTSHNSQAEETLPVKKRTSRDGRLILGWIEASLLLLPNFSNQNSLWIETLLPSQHVFHLLIHIPVTEEEAQQISSYALPYLNQVLGKILESGENHFSATLTSETLTLKAVLPLSD